MYSFFVHFCFWLSLATYVVVAFIPYAFVLLLHDPLRAHIMRYITLYLGKTAIFIGLRPFVRIKYIDAANGNDMPGIYICNHRSGLDAFLMAVFDKEMIQIVNGWPMKLPFFGFNARKSGYIDATRTQMDEYEPIFRKLLKSNVSIAVFPEGHRSQARQMNSFHSGIFRLAMELGVPVYPCVIVGNENFPDRDFRFHPTRKIIVKRLPPIMPEEFQKLPSAFVFKKKVHTLLQQEADALDAQLDQQPN